MSVLHPPLLLRPSVAPSSRLRRQPVPNVAAKQEHGEHERSTVDALLEALLLLSWTGDGPPMAPSAHARRFRFSSMRA
jgi:hypothetical protein